MALETHIRKKCFGIWSISLPKFEFSKYSSDYYLDGNCWYFKLTSHVIAEVRRPEKLYTLNFTKKMQGEMPASFLLTVYASSETEDLFMIHKLITDFDTEIWSKSRSAFIRDFPQVDIDGELKFHFFVPKHKDLQVTRRDKSVQTSPAPDRPCLVHLSLDFGKLMAGGSDADVQLKCGDCTIPAHKLVLGARSEVFRAMLQTDMQEGKRGFAEIVDMEPDTLQLFVRYLYTGSLPELSDAVAGALYEAGDKYQVRALMDRCGSVLGDNLTREKACAILVLADAHSDEKLKGRVMSYILDEKMPKDDELWAEFCNRHPKLANEVLILNYKRSG